MSRREQTLLDQIEAGALDAQMPVADVLRKVVALGGRSGSLELREWASQELRGYESADSVPEYRVVGAPLKIDGINLRLHYSGHTISPLVLPDFARNEVKQEVRLTQGVGELEAMIHQAREEGSIKLQGHGFTELVQYMNMENGPDTITSLYWSVSAASLTGVVDQVRTTLVELVAELRYAMPADELTPSAEAATQAVNIAAYGRSRVSVASNQVTGRASLITTTSPPPSRARRVSAVLVGVATIAGAIAAVAMWRGWWVV